MVPGPISLYAALSENCRAGVNMEEMKLSVIVPVYQVEEFLPRCLDSILAQTYRDFELILV